MPTISEQLTQLISDRDDLVDNLTTKGITGLTGNETFTELVPEVLNISGGSSGVTFDNVAYGLTQPSASQYKYWIPVDTTKELKPVKMVPKCQIKESVDEYDDSDNLEYYDSIDGAINYNTYNNPNKYTKDYVSTYSETSLSGTSLTIPFYKRTNLDNDTFFMGDYCYDTSNYVQVNKTNCYSDIYTTSPKVCCNTYRMRSDNYVYFVYNTSADTLKFTRYDLETQTSETLGTYTYDTSFITGTMYLHCYVKNPNVLYFLLVNRVSVGSSYGYKNKLFKADFTSGSSFTVTLINTDTSTTRTIDAIYDLTNRYAYIGSMYELGHYIIDMNDDTVVYMSSNGVRTIFESRLNLIYVGSSNTITYLTSYNTSTSFRRMYCPSTGKLYCCYLARVNNIYAPTILTPIPVVTTSRKDWDCEVQFCYCPKNENDLVTQAFAYFDITNKIAYLYTSTSLSVLTQTGSSTTKNVFETTPKLIGYKKKTSITTNSSYAANVVYSNKTNIDSSGNVIIPILSYEDYIRQSFYKFYLDENDNYTVVPVDDMGFKLPAFYNNARYDIYVSDGTNWNNVVSTSDSDYINIM